VEELKFDTAHPNSPGIVNNYRAIEALTIMETNSHELHNAPGHGWKHYLFEFFMLFLAVTLGFFVENLREYFSDKEIEKQSIKSLVTSLVSDTLQLKNIITANQKVLRHLDSLVRLRNADLTLAKNKKAFLRHSVVGFSEDWYFIPNDAALQQLRSSGILRLIRSQYIVDSIFKYETNNKVLLRQQEDCYFTFKESDQDYKKTIGLFFYRDTSVMKYSLGYDNSEADFRDINAISISGDREKVNSLFGDAAFMAAPNEAYIHLMQNQLDYGRRLIAFLKTEYHLSNE
jgi:hypothetical protein